MKHLLSTLTLLLLVTSSFAAQVTTPPPPGWELRNGAWVPIVEPGKGTPEAQVAQMIRDLEAGGKGKQIIKDATAWIKVNKTNPLMPQVILLQGDAEVQLGNKYRALFSYEDLINNFPTSDLYLPTLEREYSIADAFLNGYKRLFLGLRILPVHEDALELLNRIQDRQRGSPVAERAGMRIADYYYTVGKFQEAFDSYSDFLRSYPYSQYVRKAEIRRAESAIASFRGILFDFTPLKDARDYLAVIARDFPQSAEQLQTRAIDDRIYQLDGQKQLEVARYYWRAGKKHASAYYYKLVIDNWPDTLNAELARKELLKRIPAEAGR